MINNSINLVILISGNGSNLQAIMDAIAAKKLSAQIVAVISNRADAYGLERAKKANIPTEILEKKNFADVAAYDAALQISIDQYHPDLIILAGFMRILTADFVEHFAGKILNIHPSLLPKYPGLHTHEKVIENKDKEHGVSVHFVTEELDGGPLIAQAKLSVSAVDTAATLKEKIHKLEHRLYPEVIRWFAEGRLKMKDGQVFLDGNAIKKPSLLTI